MVEEEKKKHFPVVVVEGCDASGKSTLMQQLMARHPDNCYLHSAVPDDVLSLHRNAVAVAAVASEQRWVFIDRLHLSEKIYGEAFRGGASYDTAAFEKELLAKIPDAKLILCVVDRDTTLTTHAERRDQEMFSDVSKIWEAYNSVGGNWIRYNWKTDEIDLDTLEVQRGVKNGESK